MAMTLGTLCENDDRNDGIKLIAGSTGLDNLVRWVHTIEDIRQTDFLHGNELVFTTGIAQKGDEWLLRFAQNLHSSRAAGFAVVIGPHIAGVPRCLTDFCNRCSLPLFTLSSAVRLTDTTYDLCRRILSCEETETSVAEAFISLIFEPHEEKAYRYTLEKNDFTESASYCVAVLHIQPDVQEETELRTLKYMAQRILGKTGEKSSLFIHDRRVVTVLKNYSPKQMDSFFTELQKSFTFRFNGKRLSVGISPSGDGYSSVTQGFNKAVAALKVADARDENIVYYQNLDLYKLLVSVGSNQVLKEMYEESLGPLEQFDKENGTDYMDSLRCYLEHNSSVQEVAQLTFVHRNTINYKIRRIREILDCELTQENRLRFMLAFYIRDLLQQ